MRRTFRRPPKRKYQIVRPTWRFTSSAAGAYVTVVDPATVTGVRKVKNFKVTFQAGVISQGSPQPFFFAVVYVPKGYVPNQLYPENQNDLYSPSNNVILWGLYDPTEPTQNTWYSSLSRNLQAGDGIAFVHRLVPGSSGNPLQVDVAIQYSIAF